jgi:hypothetical protein
MKVIYFGAVKGLPFLGSVFLLPLFVLHSMGFDLISAAEGLYFGRLNSKPLSLTQSL